MPDDEIETLCTDYLIRLQRALSGVAPDDRDQIMAQVSEHLREARAELSGKDPAEMREVLERLGDPAEIAAVASADKDPQGSQPRSGRIWVGVAILVVLVAVGAAALAGAFSGGSRGPSAPSAAHRVTVPSVFGKTSTDASDELRASGLQFSLRLDPSMQVPKGVVAYQSPPAGTRIPKKHRVTLTVSTGPPAGTVALVPNVVGLSPAQASSLLEEAGLEVSLPTYAGSVVISQAPSPGSRVPQRSSVTLQTN